MGLISTSCPILFGQTRVSSDILLPSPFFSGKNARPNGENTRPNCENTRPRGLTISHNGIYFQERRFSARTVTILVFLSSGRNKYHMEYPIYNIYIYIIYIYKVQVSSFFSPLTWFITHIIAEYKSICSCLLETFWKLPSFDIKSQVPWVIVIRHALGADLHRLPAPVAPTCLPLLRRSRVILGEFRMVGRMGSSGTFPGNLGTWYISI